MVAVEISLRGVVIIVRFNGYIPVTLFQVLEKSHLKTNVEALLFPGKFVSLEQNDQLCFLT